MDQHTSHLPLDLWVHTVLKQSPEQIAEWENLFCKTALFMDPTVQNAVQSYLSADIRGYISTRTLSPSCQWDPKIFPGTFGTQAFPNPRSAVLPELPRILRGLLC